MGNKKEEKIPKPTEDIKVEKPVFKDTLVKMIKKKTDDLPDKNKK